MFKLIFCIIFSLIIKIIFSSPSCQETKNFCFRCNPFTKLCEICDKDVFIPDKNGGCVGIRKC